MGTEREGIYTATGDRKVKIQQIIITSGNPVPFLADWQFFVEDNLGEERYVTCGQTTGSFGSVATFNAKTGAQLRTDARNAVIADITHVPPNNSVT